MTKHWKELGESALNHGTAGNDLLPFTWWTDVDWKQTFQYPVTDLFAEVGFFLDVFGFSMAAFSDDYALFTTPREEFAFSAMKQNDHMDLSAFRLQFFTDNLDGILQELENRNAQPRIFEGAPKQRVLALTSPAGLPIEVWSGYGG